MEKLSLLAINTAEEIDFVFYRSIFKHNQFFKKWRRHSPEFHLNEMFYYIEIRQTI